MARKRGENEGNGGRKKSGQSPKAKRMRMRRSSKSRRAGLVFPVRNIHLRLKRSTGAAVGSIAPVWVAGVMESMARRVLTRAGDATKLDRRPLINTGDIMYAFETDEDLERLFQDIDIPPMHGPEAIYEFQAWENSDEEEDESDDEEEEEEDEDEDEDDGNSGEDNGPSNGNGGGRSGGGNGGAAGDQMPKELPHWGVRKGRSSGGVGGNVIQPTAVYAAFGKLSLTAVVN
ncbi:OLC1v1010208C1 [Oldenlandia corymbosa var. corymbosa]|uniref:Histone H2A n=1 Tax=Oldenlandia corymbosa var. corymbosa TaxID=529605 RepID=A0AAV1DQU9_OLDCO|nr:OLC1v1010208C1 [Oldenlandia corymbosa var. corymbosa]